MLTCRCGNELNWEDTINVEGGLLEGYITEQQLWCCSKCGSDYCVQASISFKESDVKIDEVLENS